MGVSGQEYWSGLPFPSPGDLPDPGIEPASPALQADSTEILWVLDNCWHEAGKRLSRLVGSRWRRGCSLPGLRSTWVPCTAPSGPPGRPRAQARHHSLGSPWLSVLARQPCFLQPSPPPQTRHSPLSLCAHGEDPNSCFFIEYCPYYRRPLWLSW